LKAQITDPIKKS